MTKRIKGRFGPGAMVAAAFIGPGTVTTATLAGARYGYLLLWAILFSIVATFVLQEMAARLGIVGRMGLGEAVRAKAKSASQKVLASFLIISAIWIGNAAYEAGNLTGAALGFSGSTLGSFNPVLMFIALVAAVVLYIGRYPLIEKVLVGLVSIMGLVFLITALLVKPDIEAILKGIFAPTLPSGASLVVIGLIGTTVVPYNLFLHASAVNKKWQGDQFLGVARRDALVSIAMGGIITMAIVISSAVALHGKEIEVSSSAELALQLRPLLGDWAETFLAIGFLAAGFSSAITAPLAASFATCGILGWPADMKSKRFRAVWMVVMAAGILFSSIGFKPILLILFAQVANGLLLPVIALFLLWIMNDKKIMRQYVNTRWFNLIAMAVVIVTIGLGFKSILSAIQWI